MLEKCSTLADLRKSKGLSLERAAQLAGISLASYYRYENGEREPSIRTAFRIADMLGISDSDEVRTLWEHPAK